VRESGGEGGVSKGEKEAGGGGEVGGEGVCGVIDDEEGGGWVSVGWEGGNGGTVELRWVWW